MRIFTREGVHRTKHFCGVWVWILSVTTDYNSGKIFKNIILKNAVYQQNCYTFLQIELRNNHTPHDHWPLPRPLKMPEKLNCKES